MKFIFVVFLLQLVIGNVIAGSKTYTASKDMVFIPGGTFIPLYGYVDNTVGVKVEPFFMDRYPVTNAGFLDFVRRFPEWRKSNIKSVFADSNYLKHWSEDLNIGNSADDRINSPVTNISWFTAKAYCESEDKRLPTMDEWEYVAMANENSPDGTKDSAYLRRILDWYGKPTTGVTPSVGSTFKNYYGVYDLHGLVWEWVLDFNAVLLTGESRGDAGLDQKLFCAGGSGGASDTKNYAAFMRYAFRASLRANYAVSNLGFRCVRSLDQ